jgi:hypothetical protein
MAAKKTTTRKSVKKPVKKPVKKTPRSKKKMDEAKLSPKQLEVVKYLKSRKATSATQAVDRKQVWKHCDIGFGPIVALKKLELLCRTDLEDGVKEYYLTKLGAAVAMQ